MMEFFVSSPRVARKEHTCEACQQKIQVGEKCKYECGKFDGEFFNRYYHKDCYMTMQDFFSDYPDDDTFDYDQVYDWWIEKYCDQCVLWHENGGECEVDMDRHIWCTKFKRHGHKET